MVSFSMTLSDTNPGFKVTVVYTYKSNISKRCVFRTKLLLHTNRKSYLTYGMVPCLVTLTDLQMRRAGCQRREFLVHISTLVTVYTVRVGEHNFYVTSCRRAAATICPAPLLLYGHRSASRRRADCRACRRQRSSRFPRPISSHAHLCSCLMRKRRGE